VAARHSLEVACCRLGHDVSDLAGSSLTVLGLWDEHCVGESTSGDFNRLSGENLVTALAETDNDDAFGTAYFS
jgi:hypothetical protein